MILGRGAVNNSSHFGLGALLVAAALSGCGSEDPGTKTPPFTGPLAGAGAVSGGLAGSVSPLPASGTTGGPTTSGFAGRGGIATAGTGVATAGAGGVAGPTTAPATGILPCGVSKALQTNCQSCHGATPIGGAPMPLMAYADFHKPAKTQPALKVYELSKTRLNDKVRPMPPAGELTVQDNTMLDTWLANGAVSGTDADKACEPATKPPSTVGDLQDGTTDPLVPLPGETCYDFTNHAGQTAGDTTPISLGQGERYEQFYFKAPWPTGSVATRFGAKLDNVKILHHWLLFSTAENRAEGAHITAPLPTLIGVNAQLLAGWALGGTNHAMPEGVGFELPAKGAQLNAQWHFYNSTGTTQTDKSSVQICVVPAGVRKNIATITWVGTEDLGGNKWFGGAGMPPHKMSTYGGTCKPGRKGMNATDPINIIAFTPHMHQLGVHMKSEVIRKDGTRETVHDKPFSFDNQAHYNVDVKLMPGDSLNATCTFNNTTAVGVPFGESSDTEMCYQFVMAWPAHSLENGVASLIGATNTCW